MKSVLIVDDVATLAEQYAYDLRRETGFDVRLASSGASHMREHEANGPTHCRVRDPARPEGAVARVESESLDGIAVHDDELRSGPRRRLRAGQVGFRAAGCGDGSANDREEFGRATGHDRVDGDHAMRGLSLSGRDDSDKLVGVAAGLVQKRLDPISGRGHDRQAVSPTLLPEKFPKLRGIIRGQVESIFEGGWARFHRSRYSGGVARYQTVD